MPQPRVQQRPQTCFSFSFSQEESDALAAVLAAGNYPPRSVPYAVCAVEAPQFPANVTLYRSGKCLVQGKGARDFVEFVLEPGLASLRSRLPTPDSGSSRAAETPAPPLSDEALAPHAGVDESGKGDFFGPLAVCAVYADSETAPRLLAAGARDSKSVSSDAEALRIAERLRSTLGPRHYALMTFPPSSYNAVYAKIRSANRFLAWAHARCIEKLRASAPGMKFAISDQFGDEGAVRRAMRRDGPPLEIRSRVRAESDIAVAAASILAREAFLRGLSDLSAQFGAKLPKGATTVRAAAEALVRRFGPSVLAQTCKCHFRTTDQVLAATGHSRDELPPECRAAPNPHPLARR